MKSVTKVARENKKSTAVVIISAIIAVATLFVEQAEFLGISTEIIRWVGFGISVFTFLLTYIESNLNR